MRTSGYPEYPAMLVAAKMLGRPVRWRSTRQEGFLTDNQARDTIIEGRLAIGKCTVPR
jgi:carbon-monoxide dehydrogenase large subunit